MPDETIYLSYRDADGQHGYKLEIVTDKTLMLKPGVLPGAYGYPDLHIQHLNVDATGVINGEPATYHLYVIATTNKALTERERQAIVDGAFRYAVKEGAIKP